MKEQKTKFTFSETMGLLGFGYKLAMKLTPSYMPMMLLRSVLTAAQPLLVLYFTAQILNQLEGVRDVRATVIYVSITVGATFLISVFKAFLTRGIDSIGSYERMYQRIKMMQAERFVKMDFAHADDSEISEVLARMDTQAMGNGLGMINVYNLTAGCTENLFSMLFSWVLLGGSLAAAIFTEARWSSWLLFGFFAAGILLVLYMQMRAQLRLKQVYVENAKANTAAGFYSNYIKEDKAAKDIRIYDQSDALLAIFNSNFNLKTWLSFFFYNSRVNGLMLGFLAVLSGGYYLIAGHGALSGSVTIGGIVQSVGAVTIFASAVGGLIMMIGEMYHNAAFLDPLREYLNLPDLLIKGKKPLPPPNGHCYEFEFKNVSFRYPGTDQYALKDLNLKFDAGRRLAVVGPNGSGKTTMIKLLCRLYDPTEGEILLDGVNIKEYDLSQYTTLFSVVFQDFFLFPFELGSNIAVNSLYDVGLAEKCLDGSGFTERLESMPDGLNSILYKTYDEDGVQISGGEAQKIALARALYRDAPFVILDEPTAALDPIAEYDVYTTFDRTIGGKSAVFISHRLSSCRFCHDIAVFDNGKLIQRGSHDELLTNENGMYYNLWNAQAQHYVQ